MDAILGILILAGAGWAWASWTMRLVRRLFSGTAPTAPRVQVGVMRCSCAICLGGAVLSGRELMRVGKAPIAVFGLERLSPAGVEKHAVCVIDEGLFQAVVVPALLAHMRAKRDAGRCTAKDLAVAGDPRA